MYWIGYVDPIWCLFLLIAIHMAYRYSVENLLFVYTKRDDELLSIFDKLEDTSTTL